MGACGGGWSGGQATACTPGPAAQCRPTSLCLLTGAFGLPKPTDRMYCMLWNDMPLPTTRTPSSRSGASALPMLVCRLRGHAGWVGGSGRAERAQAGMGNRKGEPQAAKRAGATASRCTAAWQAGGERLQVTAPGSPPSSSTLPGVQRVHQRHLHDGDVRIRESQHEGYEGAVVVAALGVPHGRDAGAPAGKGAASTAHTQFFSARTNKKCALPPRPALRTQKTSRWVCCGCMSYLPGAKQSALFAKCLHAAYGVRGLWVRALLLRTRIRASPCVPCRRCQHRTVVWVYGPTHVSSSSTRAATSGLPGAGYLNS